MASLFNQRLRQVILLLLILLLALLLVTQLYAFIPGFLGAITLYILLRERYFTLTIRKKKNPTLVAWLFIIGCLLLVAIPLYFSIHLLSIRLSTLLQNPTALVEKARLIASKMEQLTGLQFLPEQKLASIPEKAAAIVPRIINSSATLLGNFTIMFFLLYFLLKEGRQMEKMLSDTIPLKDENIDLLSNETRNMIRANAIGIPVLAIIQGVIATVGYAIFGVEEYGLWGFMTGICSMIPIVGTALVWAPLTAYFFAAGDNGHATGLLLYSLIVITNIDYVARLTILRKLMDIHPLITILGVIAGIGLFGFWGVIFGPLLISYFIILLKIYINEFGKPAN
jgi:predicted PurR-regulated permease PerM